METAEKREIAANVSEPEPTDSGKKAASSKGPPPIVRVAIIVVVGILVIVGLIWGVRTLAYATTHQTTDDAKVDADVVTITSKIAERVSRVLIDTNQFVRAGQTVVVLDHVDEQARYDQAKAAVAAQRATAAAAQSNVALTSATVDAQTQQSRGGIDTANFNISSASEAANAAAAQITVSNQAVDQSRAQQAAAQAAVPGAREGLARAQADFDRTSTLVASGDIARSQLDSARAAREAARSQYVAALDNARGAQSSVAQAQQRVDAQRATAAAARSVVGVQTGQLTTAQGRLSEVSSPYRVAAQEAQATAARAQVASLLAQLQTAGDQLKYTTIVAPISGYVGQKSVDLGQAVAPGTPLLTIVPVDKLYVTANFKETQVGKITAGQSVDIKVDAYKGVDFTGHVSAIGPASQNTFALVPSQNASGNFVKVTQRIPVRILVDDRAETRSYVLRPGMSVVASVRIDKKK